MAKDKAVTNEEKITQACESVDWLTFRKFARLGKHEHHAALFMYSPSNCYEKYFITERFRTQDELTCEILETLGDKTMANIFKMTGDLFKYMTGEMIPEGQDVTMTIKTVIVDELQNQRGKEEKVVIEFEESKKGFVLGNKTNVRQMVKLFGPETDDWIGCNVALRREDIQAFGKMQPVVRIADYHPVTKPDNVNKETGEIKTETAQQFEDEQEQDIEQIAADLFEDGNAGAYDD